MAGDIKISEKIGVSAPAAIVWAFISDPHRVASCLPGAVIEGLRDDGSYDAAMVLQFGPLKVALRANAVLTLDPATMTGAIATRGKDAQGGVRVGANTRFAVVAADAGSDILIDASVQLTGKLASVIGAGAPIVTKRLAKTFAEQLAEKLGAGAK
jgi:carbon monoxide dehydrogenase subunit G